MKSKKLIFILPIIATIALIGAFTFKKLVSKPDSKAEITVSRSVSFKAQKEESHTQSPTYEATLTETASLDKTVAFTYPSEENPCFDKCAFLGNSRFVAIKESGLAKNVYPVVGLDVRTVFTKHVTDSDVVILDELNGKDFDKIILMFGDNECGWPNTDYFIKKYAAVINEVQKRVPDAEIYLHAIIPISAATSDKNECNCNNGTIATLNARIKQLADDMDINYIAPPPCLMDAQGNLVDDAASDGIHLNRKYTVIWLGYLEKVLS